MPDKAIQGRLTDRDHSEDPASARPAATRAVSAAEPGRRTRTGGGIAVTGRDQPTLTFLTKATAIAGALFYLLWGALHIQAGIAVASLGLGLHPTVVQGRIFQDSFFLLYAAVGIIIVVLASMWKVSNWNGWKFCFWLALAIAIVSDVSFMAFILAPGYMKLWPGVDGPAAWGIALIFWTWSYVLRSRAARSQRRTGEDQSEARSLAQ